MLWRKLHFLVFISSSSECHKEQFLKLVVFKNAKIGIQKQIWLKLQELKTINSKLICPYSADLHLLIDYQPLWHLSSPPPFVLHRFNLERTKRIRRGKRRERKRKREETERRERVRNKKITGWGRNIERRGKNFIIRMQFLKKIYEENCGSKSVCRYHSNFLFSWQQTVHLPWFMENIPIVCVDRPRIHMMLKTNMTNLQ